MAPTGRGGLRPYQPSKFQPFIIVCLFVTVIVFGFNFWNLMKKNSVLLADIGKLQNDLKRAESEKKDCHVHFKEAEEQRKLHENADHEKEILLEDTRRIVEDLKAEKDTLQQNLTRLLSNIANAELFGSRKENKSRSECDQKLEQLQLQIQSSCDAEKGRLQQEATDQLGTMKKQLKLQYQETQQLDQMLQQQKQRPGEQEKKEPPQQSSDSPPAETNYIQQQNQQHLHQKQRQQKQQELQQHDEQQHQELQHKQQQQQQLEKQIDIQQNQLNRQDDQKLPSGQQIQRRTQQSGSVVDRNRMRKVKANESYRQIGKQSSGLRMKMDRRQIQGDQPGQRKQTSSKDSNRITQGEQQEEERKEGTERGQGEEVKRVEGVQPPRSKQDDEQRHGNTQVPSVEEPRELEQPRQLIQKRSDPNAIVSTEPRVRELAAEKSTTRAPDQPVEEVQSSISHDADSGAAEQLQDRDNADEVNRLVQSSDDGRVDLPASEGKGEKFQVREAQSAEREQANMMSGNIGRANLPKRTEDQRKNATQNDQDHEDLIRMRQNEQEKKKIPYQPSKHLDHEKPPEGNADV